MKIWGQTILRDTLPSLPMDQRVEVDITPVEDMSEASEAQQDEGVIRESAQKSKRGAKLSYPLSDLGISREELDVRVEADPFIRRADEHRKEVGKRRGGKSNLTTQWIREDGDRWPLMP